MRFDVYGRFLLDVVHEDGRWVAYRTGDGTRRRERDIVIPDELDAAQLPGYLEDLLHELARPGSAIRPLGSDETSGGAARRLGEAR